MRFNNENSDSLISMKIYKKEIKRKENLDWGFHKPESYSTRRKGMRIMGGWAHGGDDRGMPMVGCW